MITKTSAPQRQPAPFLGGDGQAGKGHQPDKPHCLEANGLAACVAAADDHRLLPFQQGDIQGLHTVVGQSKKGMAALIRLGAPSSTTSMV